MNLRQSSLAQGARFSIWLAVLGASLSVAEAASQTQTLTLQAGWNAVWIDPSPVHVTGDDIGGAMSPDEVFGATGISVVARPLLPAGSAEFVTDSASVFNQEDWLVWYQNPESLVNTLGAITGNQAYYIKADVGPISFDITGEVSFFTPDWIPAAYNFIGFNLSAPVSFGEFFGSQGEGGGNHPISAILRMDTSGQWVGASPADLMEPNEAFWIKSVRNSTFAGPVSVAIGGIGSIDFGSVVGDIEVGTQLLSSAELTFTNVSDTAQSPAIELVEPSPANELRIYEIVPGADALTHAIGPAGQISTWGLGSLAARSSRTVTMGAERNWTTGDQHRENLYHISVGSQYFWLPARAGNPDVIAGASSPANAATVGLWVGEVILDEVSQIDGSGLAPASSSAPMRLIVHVDEGGTPSLLGHVMFMRTKSADASVPAEPVLVLDEMKIPFFEGVETRRGKRVGRRIESVAYDLPRSYDPTDQSGLLDEVAESDDSILAPEDVTAADIEVFLDTQSARPPTLSETYLLSMPLEGAMGVGSVLRTSAARPLTLDPFHRSNPFRHAFHPQHGTGYAISRNLTIHFDGEGPSENVLVGTYTETITGLAKIPILARGSVSFTRLCTVADTQ